MQNIEIKAEFRDFDFARQCVRELGGELYRILQQVDVYFHVPFGRLKLRYQQKDEAHLIYYQRENAFAPRASFYEIYPARQPQQLEKMLSAALGVEARVEKRREVHLIDNVRVHLDTVSGLGTFIEFEAVVAPGFDPAGEREKLERFLLSFKIAPAQRLDKSYLDLMLQTGNEEKNI